MSEGESSRRESQEGKEQGGLGHRGPWGYCKDFGFYFE